METYQAITVFLLIICINTQIQARNRNRNKQRETNRNSNRNTGQQNDSPNNGRSAFVFQTRLVGPHPWEGRLEVTLGGNLWGTVCDDGFNEMTANVACRELGYVRHEQFYFGAHYGRGNDPIMLDQVYCYGNESSIWDCLHAEPAVHDCSHDEDVGLKCTELTITKKRETEKKKARRALKFRIFDKRDEQQPNSEGVVEVFMQKRWRTICNDDWDINDGRVICGQSGFKEALTVKPRKQPPSRRKSMLFNNFNCSGTEEILGACDFQSMKSIRQCKSGQAAYVSCHRGTFVLDNPSLPVDGQRSGGERPKQRGNPNSNGDPIVRLKAGKAHGEGRVEVFHAGHWGTICSIDFDLSSGGVLCRQLGFGSAQQLFLDGAAGQGVGPVWLNSVKCNGHESSIFDCTHGTFNRSDACRHNKDLGIKCHVPDNKVDEKIELVDGRFEREGRVMLLVDDHWGYVCADGWGMKDAMVACRQLGMGFAQTAITSTHYMASTAPGMPILITEVNCDGSERLLQECKYKSMTNNESCTCTNMRTAGVACIQELPDILMDLHVLQPTVFIQDWPETALACAAEENCLSAEVALAGSRRLLRFSSAILNRGLASFKPLLSRGDWEWHSCHLHYHSMLVFSHYDLIDRAGNQVAEGHKASFCLEDVYCDSGAKKYFECGGEQGISPNCVDLYRYDIDCQWIDITGLPTGSYQLRVIVNPELLVAESDFSNNEILCDIFYNPFAVTASNCKYANDHR